MPFILARRLHRTQLAVIPCPPMSSKLMLLTLHLSKTHKTRRTADKKHDEMRSGFSTYQKEHSCTLPSNRSHYSVVEEISLSEQSKAK